MFIREKNSGELHYFPSRKEAKENLRFAPHGSSRDEPGFNRRTNRGNTFAQMQDVSGDYQACRLYYGSTASPDPNSRLQSPPQSHEYSGPTYNVVPGQASQSISKPKPKEFASAFCTEM